jgi:hypothetical protein
MPTVMRRRPRGLPDAPGDYAGAFQDATNASTAMAREDFQQDQGRVLGGLQAIGALRSGRANVQLDNLSRTFGRQVGNVAASNAGNLASLDAQIAQQDADRGERVRQFDTQQGFQEDRATRGDFESDRSFGDSRDRFDRSFGYQESRDRRADTVDDRNFGDSRARYEEQFGYQQGRDARRDTVDDRMFGEDRRRSDQAFEYQRGRDTRTDEVTDRNFGEDRRRFDIGGQQFDLTRDDARTAARQQGQASLWGAALGGVAQLGSAWLGGRGGAGGTAGRVAGAAGTAGSIGRVAGAAGSAFAGAKTGAILGSVVPGVGNVVGGVLGGAIGGLRSLFGRRRG